MARKKKGQLPSGNVRIQIFDYADSDGKKHYKSFTAASKTEAQALAAEWKNNRRELKVRKTLSAACSGYIDLKKNVLSPSTVRGYNTLLKRIDAHQIGRIDLMQIDSTDIQLYISELSAEVSPKTVANMYGLISAAVKTYLPNLRLNVTLPAKEKRASTTPTTSDVQILLDNCATPELKLAVLFAAVGTMRRGEACAVTFGDVNIDTREIRINKSYVKAADNAWVLKSPKTYSSYRIFRAPDYIIDLIKSLGRRDGTVINMKPDQLYDQFRRTVDKAQLPPMRYHDLRHYAASQMHAAGWPDRYIEAGGGWKPGSSVLKRVYEEALDPELIKLQERFAKDNRFCV